MSEEKSIEAVSESIIELYDKLRDLNHKSEFTEKEIKAHYEVIKNILTEENIIHHKRCLNCGRRLEFYLANPHNIYYRCYVCDKIIVFCYDPREIKLTSLNSVFEFEDWYDNSIFSPKNWK